MTQSGWVQKRLRHFFFLHPFQAFLVSLSPLVVYTRLLHLMPWVGNDAATAGAEDWSIGESLAVAASLPAQGIKCSNHVYTTRGDKDTRKAWNGCRKKKCRNLFCTQPDCVVMSGYHQTICEKQLAQIQTRTISFYVTCIYFSYTTLAISNACLIKSSYFGAKATSFLVKTFDHAAAHVIHDIAHFKKNPVDQQPT